MWKFQRVTMWAAGWKVDKRRFRSVLVWDFTVWISFSVVPCFHSNTVWKQCRSPMIFVLRRRTLSHSHDLSLSLSLSLALHFHFQFPPMAALTSLSFSAVTHCSERKVTLSSTRFLASSSELFGFRTDFSYHYVGVRASNSASKMVVQCISNCWWLF